MAKPENSMHGVDLTITVVYSPAPRQVREWTLALAVGATVGQVIAVCRICEEFPDLKAGHLRVGIWGRKTTQDHLLNDKDRIEIYRTLRVDPKAARRERFNRQGAKSAGLFARTRPGAKAGY